MSVELDNPTPKPPRPPKPPRRNKPAMDYRPIYTLLQQNPGEWVRVSLDEISGESPRVKQIRIASAANLRGLKVQTTRQGDYIYVRLRAEVPCE